MGNDLRKIVKALREQGFEVTRTQRGHYEVRRDGRKVATFSGTPSDRRSWKNSLADAKRAGFKWPLRR